MSEQFHALGTALNQLWGVLKTSGVNQMPRLVFDDGGDWVAAIGIFPPEILLAGDGYMLAGFKFELARKPAREADRFVAQEIGA